MLPKEERLKKNIGFTATFKLKRTVGNPLFFVAIGKKKTLDIPTKVGFVVSKKIHKRATKRNRIKRLLRAAYREARQKGDIESSQNWISIIFIARDEMLNTNYKEVYNAIVSVIKKADKRYD